MRDGRPAAWEDARVTKKNRAAPAAREDADVIETKLAAVPSMTARAGTGTPRARATA